MSNRKSRFMLFILFLAIVMVAIGCSTSGKGEEPTPEAPQGTLPAASETITIEHVMGEETLPGIPKRVIVLDNGALDNILALGVKPVGAPTVQLDNPYPVYLGNQTDGITNIGTINEPNLETISSLQPDVIIGSKDSHEAIYDKLKQIAPTVYVEELGYTWKENLKLQALTVGKAAEGEKLISDYMARLQEFKDSMGEELASTEVSILRPRADHVRIYLRQSFSGIIIEDAGLPRPEAQQPDEFSMEATEEQVASMAGDVILWFSRDAEHLLKSKLPGNPLWQKLEAVQQNKVFEVDSETWLSGLGVQAANKVVDDLFNFVAPAN